MNVVVLGASNKEDRYSNIAVRRLKEKGYNVIPVHKIIKEVYGIPVHHNLSDIRETIHTVTVYVNKEVSDNMSADILGLKPKRIIFNPGAENYDLKKKAEAQGIEVVFACTIVMVTAGTF
ncbi:MAG: CoA-binding protein [Proteobacteria bacterium]|nr:CoA-binding protein [Pseudomonadota bacterium]